MSTNLKPTTRWKIDTIIGTRIVVSEYCVREGDGALSCHNRIPVPDCGRIKGVYERVPVVIFAPSGWVSVERVEDGDA